MFHYNVALVVLIIIIILPERINFSRNMIHRNAKLCYAFIWIFGPYYISSDISIQDDENKHIKSLVSLKCMCIFWLPDFVCNYYFKPEIGTAVACGANINVRCTIALSDLSLLLQTTSSTKENYHCFQPVLKML